MAVAAAVAMASPEKAELEAAEAARMVLAAMVIKQENMAAAEEQAARIAAIH